MNKKGFTLVELLAAIVVLSILALITTSAITKSVKDSKKKILEVQLNNLEIAAENWGLDNPEKLPNATSTNTNVCSYLTLDDLKGNGLIDDVNNPITNENFTNENLLLKITSIYTNSYSKSNLEYKAITDAGEITSVESGCSKVYSD